MSLCGAINVLKPQGMTSFDVISVLRKTLNIKKIGHVGTLDPAAAGVLPVFIGKATKSIDDFITNNKRYIAEVSLGFETTTGDMDGDIIKESNAVVDNNAINIIVNSFIGKQKQIPPMYSAVKVDGKKLYQLARQGKEIDRVGRDIEIFNIDILKYNEKSVLLDISCTKGTFIRTLCIDIGEKLGTYGTMSFLLRIGSGIFRIENSFTIEEIQSAAEENRISDVLLTPEKLYKNLPKVILSDEKKIMLLNGMTIEIEESEGFFDKIGFFNENSELYAIGMLIYKNNKCFVKKIREFI